MGQSVSTESDALPTQSLSSNHRATSSHTTTPKGPADRDSRKAVTAADQPNPSLLPPSHPTLGSSDSPSECPVGHQSRAAWMKAGTRDQTVDHSSPTRGAIVPRLANSRLNTHREVSSIPRAWVHGNPSQGPASQTSPGSHGSLPSYASDSSPNGQTLDSRTSASATWIYPSEEMFFNAMKRKSFNPRKADMSTVVPIHNAVNERTWQEILKWESPYNISTGLSQSNTSANTGLCGGPKLVSFAGDSTRLTPRARWNSLLGYEKPFDRHDWVVDRCGTRIEYVIDYYQGKQYQGRNSKGPSFFLDVRPKLNSWEGVRMRFRRAIRFDGS